MELRCPFVKCQSQDLRQIAPAVFLCLQCNCLSLQCARRSCQKLNRPYMAFCRNCRESLTASEEVKTSDQLWRLAARGEERRFAASSALSETLVPLDRLPYARPVEYRESTAFHADARPRLSMSFLHGLLAVHQGGGCAALLHPFRALGTLRPDELVAWCQKEPVACPRDASPFAPQILADRKRILFSHPGGAFAVHVWSLREWTLNFNERCETLVAIEAGEAWRLAAAPVVLSESALGVLLFDRSEPRDSPTRYSWGVASATERGRWLVERKPLPVVGEHCQVLQVDRQMVAFATTRGHWLWSWGNALRGEASQLRQTWPTLEHTGKLVLDDEIDTGSSFHIARQVLVHGAHEREHTDWYFTIERGSGRTLAVTRIPPITSLDAGPPTPTEPRDVESTAGALPLGGHALDIDRPPLMTVIRDTSIYLADRIRIVRLPRSESIESTENAACVLFSDPWFATIGAGVDDKRPVVARNLRHPGRATLLKLPLLAANPVLWSNWLFTLEYDSQQGAVIRRHPLAGEPVLASVGGN